MTPVTGSPLTGEPRGVPWLRFDLRRLFNRPVVKVPKQNRKKVQNYISLYVQRPLKAGLHVRRKHKHKHMPRGNQSTRSFFLCLRCLWLCLRRTCKPALRGHLSKFQTTHLPILVFLCLTRAGCWINRSRWRISLILGSPNLALTLSLPSSKSTLSHPFKDKCTSEV